VFASLLSAINNALAVTTETATMTDAAASTTTTTAFVPIGSSSAADGGSSGFDVMMIVVAVSVFLLLVLVLVVVLVVRRRRRKTGSAVVSLSADEVFAKRTSVPNTYGGSGGSTADASPKRPSWALPAVPTELKDVVPEKTWSQSVARDDDDCYATISTWSPLSDGEDCAGLGPVTTEGLWWDNKYEDDLYKKRFDFTAPHMLPDGLVEELLATVSPPTPPRTTIKRDILMPTPPRTIVKRDLLLPTPPRTTVKRDILMPPPPRTTIKRDILMPTPPRTTVKRELAFQP